VLTIYHILLYNYKYYYAMEEYKKHENHIPIWLIPFFSLLIQVFAIALIYAIAPYKIEHLKGNTMFWFIYLFYTLVVVIYSFTHIILILRMKKFNVVLTSFSIEVILILTLFFAYLIADQNLLLTIVLILLIQSFYFAPFFIGIHKLLISKNLTNF